MMKFSVNKIIHGDELFSKKTFMTMNFAIRKTS